jgi:hypothetical protein
MNPQTKRFNNRWLAAAEAVARLPVNQDVREIVATSLTEAFDGKEDFLPELFWLLAADPLVDCAGPGDGQPCPHGRSIRIPMHLSSAPDGRSAVWAMRPPVVRCVSCGSPARV